MCSVPSTSATTKPLDAAAATVAFDSILPVSFCKVFPLSFFFSAIFLIVVWFSSSTMSGIDECLDAIAQDRIFFSASSAHMCILRVSNVGLGMTTDS